MLTFTRVLFLLLLAAVGGAAWPAQVFTGHLSGSFSGQSPQNFDPPPFRSCRRPAARAPVQIADTRSARTSPSTRLAYGSAHPHTIRPSQSSTIVLHGQEQVKRVAK